VFETNKSKGFYKHTKDITFKLVLEAFISYICGVISFVNPFSDYKEALPSLEKRGHKLLTFQEMYL
jgi:hypothetical protein